MARIRAIFNDRMPIIHFWAKRRMYVKKVYGKEIMKEESAAKEWLEPEEQYFVECTKFGSIDWQNAYIFTDTDELVARDQVFLVNEGAVVQG